ncbi:MAG: DNA polymerase III subunit gamma/tau [Planctomycetota bacterium]|nr:DNA polymerase III subunit gamma/tau [Planctomycetota bacterium]
MSEYLVLARKYRSATFDEVVGQEHVATTLVNAIKSGRVAHAFLFTGTRGIGKTTMARILAKALNCLSSEGPVATPCNECQACLAIARGDDIDVVEIDGASNRGIENIRELRDNAIYRPARCRYKIYYIDEVHQITKDAFNALLKTLEEPPEHVKFIFATTEPEKIPATILSRCQRFDFRDIPTGKITKHLENICKAEDVKVTSEAIFRIARAAAGSMRDGLSLLDQLLAAGAGEVGEDDVIAVLGTPSDERTSAIVTAIAEGDSAAALDALAELLASGLTLESAVSAIGEMFRHMMLSSSCGADSPLIELPDSQRKVVAELAGKFTLPAIVQAVSMTQTTGRNLRGLLSGRGLVEAMLVRLAAADKFVDAQSLIERLERLSSGRSAASGPAGRRPAPAPAGQKKKTLSDRPVHVKHSPLAHDDATLRGDSAPATATPALDNPSWTEEYIRGQWPEIVSALNGNRQGHVAGLLRPAMVLGLDGDALRLGFDSAHEVIRRRCAERMDDAITSALGGLFGRADVVCKYVPMGESDSQAAPAGANAAISSAQRAQINNDPVVKSVLDFFDGTVTNITRQIPPASEENA